jgi:hypothetical protein
MSKTNNIFCHHGVSSSGQVLMEYVLVIGVVMMVLFTMNIMIKRSAQSMIKLMADQIGNQADGEQNFDDSGHMESSYSTTRIISETKRSESGGRFRYDYNDQTGTATRTSMDLGFTSSN